MVFHNFTYEVEGFVHLRVVKGHGTGYEQQSLLTERSSLRGRFEHPPVEFNKWDWNGRAASKKRHPDWYESDAPGNNYMSGRAANVLRDLLEEHGELLPLESKDGEFYVYHCMNEIDAVDPPRVRRHEHREIHVQA